MMDARDTSSLADTVPSGLPPVAVATLAAELGITVADTIARLGAANVFRDAIGFRVTTAFRAAALLHAHDRQQEAMRRQAAAVQQRIAAMAAARPVRRGAALEVPPDTLPVQALVAQAASDPPVYDGATLRPTPGRLDWLFGGAGDSGEMIGPDPRDRKTRGGAK